MELHATLGAATADVDDDESFANLYCFDAEQDYCFSLLRFPEDTTIEVMVRDQLTARVDDLSVRLTERTLEVELDERTAARLDGNTHYVIHLAPGEHDRAVLRAALAEIFDGKRGYRDDTASA
ncbi:hypothetical protein [Burkholderia vietnamiensis]|uniref:hypothetical protein n=1 Tax=Burkholderia vietnamiensis TaxID=60552 RepID=UPI000757D196|nr:hypothetical protein [Burkholderia vietnamiensis]KVE25120.1 hypothetical protein WI93_17150 [Burkholderia vietnamiensis]KVE72766.1 hypothetical protein WI97_28185 [Burkholderia vietnamiensis]KVE74968.1 hypothetical protein WI98_13940 [Burkholderia vietnamiensis]KVE93684.1 hypothetical protein WJ01_19895 [Burkholderia vietnamiensis]KVF02918.1 hypothetical protein WJ04_25580 [Burkholderia vietnamiensis]